MTYRKCLWLAILVSVAGVCLVSAEPPAAGFHSLLNGKDLAGWEGDSKIWSARDGILTGQTPEGKPTADISWNDGRVDDFELRLAYRFIADNPDNEAHIEIQFRTPSLPANAARNWVVTGYRAILRQDSQSTGVMQKGFDQLPIAQPGQRVKISSNGGFGVTPLQNGPNAKPKADGWNDLAIIAQGGHIVEKINEHVVVDLTDQQVNQKAQSGLLGVKLVSGKPMKVEFKDIQIKRLPLEGMKKIILIAGSPSHGPGDHEHNAGVALWKHWLDKVPGILAAAYLECEGWPRDPSAFDNADAAVFFVDGGDGNPIIQGSRLKMLGDFLARGKGMAAVHYTVEVPKNHGGQEFISWIGGYYETGYSINPFWKANFQNLPVHPITWGVKPFQIEDEWYYNIRWADGASGVIPLLQATPPDDTRGTPAAKEHLGRLETVSWCVERPDGGRGFGYTGGHVHKNWANDDVRKFILNAIVWTAKGEIPPNGIESQLASDDIQYNLDAKDNQKNVPAPWLSTVKP